MTTLLELHGLQHHGQAFDHVWQWPPAAECVHFEDILHACPLHNFSLMPHLDACTLRRCGEASQTVWQFSTGSSDIACNVNSTALDPGAPRELHDGDILEVGLYRFRVHIPCAAQAAPNPLNDFRLTDLDAPVHEPFAAVNTTAQFRTDFADLISLSLEQNPLPSAQQASAFAAPAADAAATQAPSLASADPLDTLHAQYLRKLRDPAYNGDDAVWQNLVQAKEVSTSADAFEDIKTEAGPSQILEDLLGQSRSIDDVLAGLGTIGVEDVLTPEPFDSVIHLFAPQDLQPKAAANLVQDPLAQLVQNSLPSLTRREHHSLTLDSAMPIFAGQDISTKDIPTP